MKKNNKTPKLRFSGYTDDWEQRKLGDIAEFSKGSGYSKGDLIESGTPIILYGRLYTKYETSISEVDTYVEAKDGSVYSKGGEVIVPASGETAEDIARAATVDKSGVILGGDLNVVSPNEDINSAFLAISISHGNSQRELAKKAQGKSVVHIHNEEIKNLVVPFPAKAEQNKIEEYFSNLDNIITLHQRIIYKFSEKLTFTWEQRKLGEVAQEFKSGNFLKADEIDIAGDYPVYGGNGLRGYTSTYNHDGEFALIGRQGALCGNMNYSVGKAYFTEHAVVVEADENNDTRFLYCMLDIMNLGQYSDQSAQPGLAVNKLIKLENFFPQKEEQQQIGWYFNTLDRLITLHQRNPCNLNKFMAFDWEQRKLGNVLKFQNGFNGSKERYGTGTKLISVMDILNDDFITYESIRGLADVTEEEKERFSVDFGDVLFQRSSENVEDAGRTNVYLDRKRAVFGGFVIRGKKNSDYQPEFMRYVLDTKMIRKQITTKAQGAQHINVSQETLQDVLFCLPSKEEQIRIGNYFRNLDNLITLHQRKYDEMKTLKKYMLQKMFPQNGPKIPKIRFEGFTGEWEQRKLGDLADRVTRKNQDLVSELPLTISAQYGLIDQNEFFDKRVASKDVSGYYLIENGEFAYNKSTDAPWGAIKRLDRYENGVLSTLYIVFGIKENNPVDSDFLVLYYSTNLWHKGIHEIAAEGARNHGLLNIAPADFFETKLMISQDIEEQNKIGKYFEELERLITLHQRKCNELKNIKKFMLQSMFV